MSAKLRLIEGMVDSMTIKLGLVGIGKIARAEHLPAIAARADMTLAAVASRNATVDGVSSFKSLAEMLAAVPEIEAVSLCAPPNARTQDAHIAIAAGKHVMLEKPPASTLAEIHQLAEAARRAGVTLFTTWHSRCAAGVENARQWLMGKAIRRVDVSWREDVRVWHPGQDWIFEAGGFGVFDPGINALSILTHILPESMTLRSARMDVPSNRQAPIAAELHYELQRSRAPLTAIFDFLQTGPQTWDIVVETDAGMLKLAKGGAVATVDVNPLTAADTEALGGEYHALYRRFGELIRSGQSDVDLTPLVHVADCFMCGDRTIVEPFNY